MHANRSTLKNQQFLVAFLVAGFFGIALPTPDVCASDGHSFRRDLAPVMQLYGLDAKSAEERLDAEAYAAVIDRRIREAQLPGYAGSWFDVDTLKLRVATTNRDEFPVILLLGGTPTEATHSNRSLNQLRSQITSEATSVLGQGVIRSSYIQVQTNRVVFEVLRDRLGDFSSLIAGYGDAVFVKESRALSSFSSGSVLGGEGTRNHTWETNYGGSWICSVGIAVNQGFLTAGHCTFGDNVFSSGEEIRTRSGVLLGVAQASTFGLTGPISSQNPRDVAWIQTSSGWTPTAQINGYSSGILDVPAEWSGMLDASINATVCRYGATSGGPFCGQVSEKDVTECFGPIYACDYVGGLTRVSNGCTEDGDSGGPYLSPSNGQIQGTNTGGEFDCSNHPTISGNVFYQPVSQGTALMGRTMLTSHGATAPTVQGLHCFGTGNSTFFCSIDSFRSQGETSLSWSSSQGGSSSNGWFNGSCTGDVTVNVSLLLTNQYGSSTANTSVFCYSGPPL